MGIWWGGLGSGMGRDGKRKGVGWGFGERGNGKTGNQRRFWGFIGLFTCVGLGKVVVRCTPIPIHTCIPASV